MSQRCRASVDRRALPFSKKRERGRKKGGKEEGEKRGTSRSSLLSKRKRRKERLRDDGHRPHCKERKGKRQGKGKGSRPIAAFRSISILRGGKEKEREEKKYKSIRIQEFMIIPGGEKGKEKRR